MRNTSKKSDTARCICNPWSPYVSKNCTAKVHRDNVERTDITEQQAQKSATLRLAEAEAIATHAQIWKIVRDLTCDAPVSAEQAKTDAAKAMKEGTAEQMLHVALLELKQIRDAVRDFQPKASIAAQC